MAETSKLVAVSEVEKARADAVEANFGSGGIAAMRLTLLQQKYTNSSGQPNLRSLCSKRLPKPIVRRTFLKSTRRRSRAPDSLWLDRCDKHQELVGVARIIRPQQSSLVDTDSVDFGAIAHVFIDIICLPSNSMRFIIFWRLEGPDWRRTLNAKTCQKWCSTWPAKRKSVGAKGRAVW